MKVVPSIPAEVKPYFHLFNNTGGNDVEDLWKRYHTEKNMAFSNIVLFTMCASVESQINLIMRLKREGLLK